MLRDRIRAAARLKGSTSQQNNFRQSVVLVVIGATISFVSSITANYYSSKSENRKMAIEQKLLFERDVVNCISLNLAAARKFNNIDFLDVSKVENDNIVPNIRKIDSVYDSFEKERADWTIRTTSVQLLMNSYVDTNITNRFYNLDNKLSNIISGEAENFLFSTNDSLFDKKRHLNSMGYVDVEIMFENFMREFHSAILK